MLTGGTYAAYSYYSGGSLYISNSRLWNGVYSVDTPTCVAVSQGDVFYDIGCPTKARLPGVQEPELHEPETGGEP